MAAKEMAAANAQIMTLLWCAPRVHPKTASCRSLLLRANLDMAPHRSRASEHGEPVHALNPSPLEWPPFPDGRLAPEHHSEWFGGTDRKLGINDKQSFPFLLDFQFLFLNLFGPSWCLPLCTFSVCYFGAWSCKMLGFRCSLS